MFVDIRNEFASGGSTSGALINTATLPDAVSDVIDLGSTNTTVDIGAGKEIYLVVIVHTGITNAAGTETLTLTLRSNANADLETGSPTTHITKTVALATTATAGVSDAGTVLIKQALPIDDYQRYLGLYASISGSSVNAGQLDAFLTQDPDAWKAYADAAD